MKRDKKGLGFFSFIMFLGLVFIFFIIATFIFLSWKPQNISGVEGVDSNGGPPLNNLYEKLLKLKQSGKVIKITEKELNLYLASRLKMRQQGFISDYMSLDGVYVNLTPNNMEVIFDRSLISKDVASTSDELFGFLSKRQTCSISLDIRVKYSEKEKELTRSLNFKRCKIGKTPLFGQLVTIVKPALDTAIQVMSQEIEFLMREVNYLKIEEGVMLLSSSKL